MRRIVLVALMLAVTAGTADARRRHHQHYYPYDADRTVGMAPDTMPEDRAYDRRSRRDRAERGARDADARMGPGSWQLQPPDPKWHGKRYVSPDGGAWYASYESPSEQPAADHMKT